MLWVLFAHYIGDFALQNEWIAEMKGEYWYVMLAHCMIWTGCICFVLKWLGMFAPWKFLFLFFGHFLCDRCFSTCKGDSDLSFYADQFIHMIQCVVVSYDLLV